MEPFPTIDVFDLLIAAGAPKPWKNPSYVATLEKQAQCCIGYIKRPRAEPWPPRVALKTPAAELLRQAHNTMAQLNDAIELSVPTSDDADDHLSIICASLSQERSAVAKLIAALDCFRSRPRLRRPKLNPAWHAVAVLMYRGYKTVVGSASTGEGPAVRFIQSVLIKTDNGDRDLGTIEQALRRWMTTNQGG